MERQTREAANLAEVKPPLLTALLQALGLIDLAVTVVGLLLVLGWRTHSGQPMSFTFIITLLGALVAGVTLGGLLIGAAAALRYGHVLASSLTDADRHLRYGGGGAVGGRHFLAEDQPAGSISTEAEQMVALLTDIRDLQLLPAPDREEAQARFHARAQRRAAEDVIDAINNRQLGKARTLLQEAETAYGAAPTLERLRGKINEATKRNEALDFVRAKRMVEDAIGEGQWALAEQYAHTLYFDHPDSARGRQLWQSTRRARLYAHIQKSAEQHHWAEAAAAAEEFVGRFPDSRETEALHQQLSTLRTNAEILQRKQYEAKFKELIGAQQYDEALRIARHVVEHYPESPQAQALRDQIPVLEKHVTG